MYLYDPQSVCVCDVECRLDLSTAAQTPLIKDQTGLGLSSDGDAAQWRGAKGPRLTLEVS